RPRPAAGRPRRGGGGGWKAPPTPGARPTRRTPPRRATPPAATRRRAGRSGGRCPGGAPRTARPPGARLPTRPRTAPGPAWLAPFPRAGVPPQQRAAERGCLASPPRPAPQQVQHGAPAGAVPLVAPPRREAPAEGQPPAGLVEQHLPRRLDPE